MRSFPVLLILIVPILSANAVHADVIISEIMYNPASPESFNPNENLVEWVEIYNNSDTPVDVTGWHLQDEDGRTKGLPATRR